MNLKYKVINGLFVMVTDCVNFITSNNSEKIDVGFIKSHDNYRLFLSHGVTGEILLAVENDFYGLDRDKIIVLCNNMNLLYYLQSINIKAYLIPEFIFMNDEYYKYEFRELNGKCIFPGRSTKLSGLDINKIESLDHIWDVFQREMSNLYNTYSAGLMLSRAEGSCRAVTEMLLCGLPVVTTSSMKLDSYYPEDKDMLTSCYSPIFPRFLGGREILLEDNNSIVCDRNEKSIEISIKDILTRKYDRKLIADNCLNTINHYRKLFLYCLRENLTIPIDNYEDFVNPHYSMHTSRNDNWVKVFYHFKRLINE